MPPGARPQPLGGSNIDQMLAGIAGGLTASPVVDAPSVAANPNGIKPATLPGDVKPVTSTNGWGGVLDAFKAVGGQTPGEYQSEADKILAQVNAANAPAIKGITSNIAKRDQILSQPVAHPVIPQLGGMPRAPDQSPRDPKQVFQQNSTILAMLGSLFTRKPLVTAMNAAAAAMKGYAEGDKDAAERAHKTWKDSLEAAVAQNQAEMDQYNLLMQDTSLTLEDRNAQLAGLAASNNDQNMLAALKSGAPDMQYNLLQGRQKSAESLTGMLIQSQQFEQQQALEQARIAESQRHNLAVEGGIGGGGDPDTMAHAIAEGRMPALTGYSLRQPWGREIMAKVMEINPDYNAAIYGQHQSALRAFGSGKQGDTIRSMNVAIAHLDTIEQLGKALQNGDVQMINEAAQRVAAETGNPAPTNFDAAKAIVGDEIIKSVVGGGAGALADRDNAQNQLKRSNSPEQMLGVISGYKQLLAGQLRGIKLQYKNSTGLDNFDDLLAPETQKELDALAGENSHPYAATLGDKNIYSDDGQSWYYDDGTAVKP